MVKDLESFFSKTSKWQSAYIMLRSIIHQASADLHEELKWGKPCYTLNGANVLLIHGFKDYCAILFHQGALLKDKEQVLTQQTENVQAARQIRFSGLEEIEEYKYTIRAYINEAVENQKKGLKVEMKKTKDYPMVEEFKIQLDSDPQLNTAFKNLTPGRQRGYLLYFSNAKQSKTRTARVQKFIPKIIAGKGLDD